MFHHFRLVTLATVFNFSIPTQAQQAPQRADEPILVVVTATRFPDAFLTKPVNVSIITADEIKSSGATTLPDVIAQKAGVTVHDFFGNNGAFANIDLRGFGATSGQNTLILLNGQRLSDMDTASVQWATIPVDAIERIEILRGSGSVLYGDGASAGVVNIITKETNRDNDRLSATVKRGSHGTKDEQLYANRSGERGGISIAAGNFYSDGYRQNNSNRQQNVETKAQWTLEQGELQASAGADRQRIRLPGGRLVDVNAGINLLQSDPQGAATPQDFSTRDGGRFGLQYQRQTGIGELLVDFGRRDRKQTIYSQTNLLYQQSDMSLTSFSPRLRIGHGAPGGGKGALVIGTDYQRWSYDADYSQDQASANRPYSKVQAGQSNLAFYAQEATDVRENLSLLAGIRRETQRITATNQVDAAAPGWDYAGAAPQGDQSNDQWAGEIGLRYRLSPVWALTGKLARSFRFANIDEIYEYNAAFDYHSFQFLLPQTTKLREVGIQRQEGPQLLKASLFQEDVRNEIHLDPFTAGVGNTNLPPSRRRGLELESVWRFHESLGVSGAYTYTSAKFIDGVFPGTWGLLNNVIAGKTVPLVPHHKLNLGLNWHFAADSSANLSLVRVSAQYMDNDEANNLGTTIPANTLVNATVDHRFGDWRLGLAVNNLFNQKHFNYAVKSQFTANRYNAYPLPERSLMATAEIRFR